MNINQLTEKLTSNSDSVHEILESLGFINIKFHNNGNPYFQFPRLDGDNQGAMVLYAQSLQYECFTRNDKGNLYSLVMKTKGYKFPEALRYICKVIGIKDLSLKPPRYPFGGFYKKLTKRADELDENLKVYPESILEKPQYCGQSYKYFKDGVSFDVQKKFGIRFDHVENAIVIPIRNSNGDLVGVKCRNNDDNCEPENRFWASHPYSKSSIVYGLYENYEYIVNKGTMLVFESEKAVMQCRSFGCNLAVAVGGHDISQVQRRIILSTLVPRIIICFDEGLPLEELIKASERLSINTKFHSPLVGYLYDENHQILEKGSKNSPSDVGIKKLKALLSEEIRWV